MADEMQNPQNPQQDPQESQPQAEPMPQGFSLAEAMPQGYKLATVPPPNASSAPAKEEPGFLERMGKSVRDITEGAGAGLLDSFQGGVNLAHKVIHADLPHSVAEKLSPSEGMGAMNKMFEPLTQTHNTMQKIGYGGETLTEFIMGDEALKGLSMADKLLQSANVMKLLEKSPRLMAALKAGANISKAVSELGPEEQAFIKKSPVLARLVSAGMDAVRQGTVQGAQTTVRTGGDVKEGIKQGAEMGAASGVIGGTGAAIGGTLAKVKNAAEVMDKARDVASSAPTKEELGSTIQNLLKGRETQMHNTFETGINAIKDKLKGAEITLEDSPLQEAAKNILDLKKGANKLDTAFAEAAPVSDGAKKFIKSIANALKPEAEEGAEAIAKDPLLIEESSAAKKAAEEPPHMLKADDLIEMRQKVLKRMRGMAWDNPDKSAYGQILGGIDDSLGKLAEASKSPEAIAEYAKLRQGYKETLGLFTDKNSKAVIRSLMDGGLKDASATIINSQKAPAVIDNLRKLVGPQYMDKFSKDILHNWMADAGADLNAEGQMVRDNFNPEKFADKWAKLNPTVRQKLFQNTPQNTEAYNNLMKEVGQTVGVKRLIKYGIIPATFGTTGAVHGPFAAMVAALAGGGLTSFGKAAHLLDWIGNHPNTWKGLGFLGNLGADAEASALVNNASTAVKMGAVGAVNSNGGVKKSAGDAKERVYNAAKNDKVGKAARRVYSKTADVLGE